MIEKSTLLLTRSDIAALLEFSDYFTAVEAAFRAHGQMKMLAHGLLHLNCPAGEFHIKAGALQLDRVYFAVKSNGGFYQNTARYGLPNILGTIALYDGETGYPLAILDSGEITRQRTAAAVAVAAKYLARPESRIVTVCGCGVQGRTQVKALQHVFRITKVFAFDVVQKQREHFAEEVSRELGIDIEPVADVGSAVRQSDLCVTCTPSHQYFLRAADVVPGTFIAAMGADSPEKQELEPRLVATNKIVVDILDQCANVGELHHVLARKLMSITDVYAELGEIVAGIKAGRTSADEIIVFDSTGTAMQDVAAATAVFLKAKTAGRGLSFSFME